MTAGACPRCSKSSTASGCRLLPPGFSELGGAGDLPESDFVVALQRDHLHGAALDVYVGEFEHTPTLPARATTGHIGWPGLPIKISLLYQEMASRTAPRG